MKNNASAVYALLLLLGDFLALVAAFALAYALRFKIVPGPSVANIPGRVFIYSIVAVLPLWLLVQALIGLYSPAIYERRLKELGRLVLGSVLGILLFIGYDFMTGRALFPGRLVPLYGLVIGFLMLAAFRILARALRRQLFRLGVGITNVLLVGDTDASAQIAAALADPASGGIRLLGSVGRQLEGLVYFRSFKEAVSTIGQEPIHGIVQTELYKTGELNDAVLQFAQTNHAAYRFVPGNSDLFVGNITVELFAGLPVIAVHQTPLIGWGRVVKRLFDLAASLLGLMIISPLLLLIAGLIKVFEPQSPVLFRQHRLTRFNRQFTVYKFRTVRQAYNGLTPEQAFAKMGKPKLAEVYRANGDFLPADPRFSPIGRLLRRFSLDELPQLFNVLRGDISLVGPRALIPAELNQYEKRHTILSVKSGLTGLAQISGRRDISFEERRTIDMYYVQNWTFWMDINILLRTIRAVLTASGSK